MSVFNFSTDIGIAVSEEELLTGALVETEYLDVNLGQSFAGYRMGNRELTIALKGGDLELVGVEGLKLLLFAAVDLDD